jgi:hypothetical protein
MKKTILICLLVAGCAATSDPEDWSRVDCVQGDPESRTLLERAAPVCWEKARAVAAVVSPGPGVSRREIADASFRACMAERGYLLSTEAEFKARCRR